MIFALGLFFTTVIFTIILILTAGFKSRSDLNYLNLFHFKLSQLEPGFITA
jgi:hypothetical protein